MAHQFADRYADHLRYCHDTGAWFRWDGNIWRQVRTGIAFQWARGLARSMAVCEPAKIRYTTSKISFAGGSNASRAPIRCLPSRSTFGDTDPWLLGTPAGTVDLRTGELRPARQSELITKATAVAPAATANCPTWLRFLEDATKNDAELTRFLQQWAGYSLTGITREHALVFAFGPGDNGKTVFINVLTGIVADYAATAAMETFAASHSDRHPTDLAMLRGARLVTASLTEEGRAWAETRIKTITGGDRISARFMRLEAKLKAEWPGILRWAIDGCLQWQNTGLVRPASVQTATGEYFAAQDLFGQWLDDECDADPGNGFKRETSADP